MTDLVTLLSSIRAPLHDEKATQIFIANSLDAAGMSYEREVSLAAGGRVDFMVGAIAVEVKIKGNRSQIIRQLQRYAAHNSVSEIILLTARSIILPPLICGKPTITVSLSRAWI